jgi:hypothetical protein
MIAAAVSGWNQFIMYGHSSDGFVSPSAEPIVVLDCLDEMPSFSQNAEHLCSGTAEDSFLRLVDDLEKEYSATGDRRQFALRYQAWIDRNGIASPALFAAWFNIGVELTGAGDRTGAIDAYRNALSLLTVSKSARKSMLSMGYGKA